PVGAPLRACKRRRCRDSPGAGLLPCDCPRHPLGGRRSLKIKSGRDRGRADLDRRPSCGFARDRHLGAYGGRRMLCGVHRRGSGLVREPPRVAGVAWGSAGDRTRLLALRSSQLRLVLMTAWLSGVSWGAFSVVLPRLAEQTGSAGAAGALLASVSLGSIVVGLGLAGRIARIPVRRRYPGLLA